ncbi:hypothetical protein CRUP_008597, partial [Coryphaenoides rupestris]
VELSDSTSHTITDAIAGKEYIIQVAAKDTEIGTWSDWSVAVHATPWMDQPKQITSTTDTSDTVADVETLILQQKEERLRERRNRRGGGGDMEERRRRHGGGAERR